MFFSTWLVFEDKNDEIRDWFKVRTFFFFKDHYDFGTKNGELETDFKRGPFFLKITMILGRKMGNWRLILSENLFLEISMILGQKSRCIICLACQYF